MELLWGVFGFGGGFVDVFGGGFEDAGLCIAEIDEEATAGAGADDNADVLERCVEG